MARSIKLYDSLIQEVGHVNCTLRIISRFFAPSCRHLMLLIIPQYIYGELTTTPGRSVELDEQLFTIKAFATDLQQLHGADCQVRDQGRE